MQIVLAKNAGFCFGVSKAVNTAYELAEHSGKGKMKIVENEQFDKGNRIFSLGAVIHNKMVISELEKSGIKVIESIEELDFSKEEPPTVIIRAHGIPKIIHEKLKNSGVNIVDATCPYVKKIHCLVAEKYNDGYSIVIAGDEKHPEVIGINGWCEDKAEIISEPEDVFQLNKNAGKYCLLAQTTFSMIKWELIKDEFKKQFDNFLYFDTICIATVKRQEEAAKVAEKVDLMIVIGDKMSSNTRKLVEICLTECSKTFLIESVCELERIDFENIKKVGITAGASTPKPVIREVINKMSDIGTNTNDNFEAMLEESLTTLTTGQTVKGNIIRVDDKGVFIDLGFKYEGFVAIDEFREQPSVGDEVEAVVARVNDKDGEVTLSKRRIDSKKNIKFIEEAYENKTPVTVRITDVVNGGLVGNAMSVRVFIPASQLASRFVADLSSYLKKEIDVRIVTFEKGEKNRLKIVGSHKIINDEVRAKVEDEFWSGIEIGKEYKGKVRSLTSFGAFVDLGGIDGLVHLTELSWKKIRHPSEVVSVGDEIDVFVIKFDTQTRKISLGHKKDSENPWKDIFAKYNVGDIISAKVVKFLPFGAFVEIEPGLDGLVHISQISNVRLNKVQDALIMGQVVEAKIVEMNEESRKINLSIREVAPIDPVKTVEEESEIVTEEVVETVEAEEVAEMTVETEDVEVKEEAPEAEEVSEESAE